MKTPEECPNCLSRYVGIEPATNLWVCFRCGFRIGVAGSPMINPFMFGGHG